MTTTSTQPRARRSRRKATRGFTLVELIVAMLAGLLVALGALILSRNATRFFQHEARIATATLAAQLGINRLSADIQRAGFLSTPNIATDPATCGAVSAVVGLRELAGLQLEQDGSVNAHPGELWQSIANGFQPDAIIIGGAFDTVEQFPIRAIIPGGGGAQIFLQTDSLAMARTLKATANGAATLQQIFAGGRYMRIVDQEGHSEWGVIAAAPIVVGANPPTSVVVTLTPAPGIQQKTGGNLCGFTGFGVGTLANPVSRVRYDIRSLFGNGAFPNAQPAGGAQVGAAQPFISAPLTGDTGNAGNFGRTELVRVELDNTGAEIPATMEIIAEFAVDLKFGITWAATGSNPGAATREPITAGPENANIYTKTQKNIWGGGVGTPERVRSVQVRLATRTRAPDRELDIPMAQFNPADGRRFRFLIDANLPPPRYARLRTLYSEVSLPNQMGVQW